MEFRTSIPKTLGLLALGIVMIAVSYFAATRGSGYQMAIAWFGVIFFALMFVLGCIQLFRRGSSIVMNAEGISGPRMGAAALRWSDIAAVSIGQIRRQKFLCLWLRDQDAYVAQLPPARRLTAKANVAVGFSPAVLSFGGLTPGLPQALEYALKYVPRKPGG